MSKVAKPLAGVLIPVVAFCLGVALCVAMELRSPFESFGDELTFAVLGEDTEYAPEYTTSGFCAIRIGDSESRVRNLVGTPISVYQRPGQPTVLAYTRSPSDTHYRLRKVHVVNGAVTRIVAELYFD